MKKNLLGGILAAGLICLPAVKAATVTTSWGANDLLMGLNFSGKEVLIDLGAYNYYGVIDPTPTTFSLTNVMSAAGWSASWTNSTSVTWGLMSATYQAVDPTDGVSTTNQIITTSTAGYDSLNSNVRNATRTIVSNIANLENNPATPGIVTTTTVSANAGWNYAVAYYTASAVGTSFNSLDAQLDGGGSAWGAWGSKVMTAFTGSAFTNNIYMYTGQNGDADFTSNSIATISYDGKGTFSIVPEPSSYFLMGLGALVVLVVARNRKNA